MPAAARIGDPIGHSPTMNWLLAGLLAGAAIAVVGVAIIGTGGLAAVAIVGAGAAAGAGLGEVMSTMSWAPKEVTGMIAGICSINVFTNAMPAARAHLDMIMCGKHPGPPIPIATGSGQVYINGMPAARVDDKTGCGGVVTKGSSNVFIGGGTVQTDTINPENLVPGWVHAALLVVGVGAAVVLAGPVIAIGGLIGGVAGALGGGWLGGKVFGEGSDGQKWSSLAGSFLGGFLGAKGAPGAWNFLKRVEVSTIPGTLGANGGNIRVTLKPPPSPKPINAPANRGHTFVGENLGTPRNAAMRTARDYESGTPGAFSDIATRQRQVPALRFDNRNPNGAPYVKFDGYRRLDDGTIELIDSKTRIVPFATKDGPFLSPSVRDGLVRKSEALAQNPGYKGVIELPTVAARREAQQVLRQLGITNISTRVR